MAVEILNMTGADVRQVAALELACFSDPWPESILEKELENELSLWLVAKEADAVLGYVGSQSVLGEADMMNLAVCPAARRQGIAKKLVTALCARLKDAGVQSLTLEVRASNFAAAALYEGLGFLQVGLRPNYYYHPKEDARILRKELEA